MYFSGQKRGSVTENNCTHYTTDHEFFRGKIFRQLNFRLALFSSIWPYKLSQFICWRKSFVGLIFVVEGDQGKFFPTKIFRSTVSLIIWEWFRRVEIIIWCMHKPQRFGLVEQAEMTWSLRYQHDRETKQNGKSLSCRMMGIAALTIPVAIVALH